MWATQLEHVFPKQIYDNWGAGNGGGGERSRKREREQLILDREQLRKPLSLPSSHLPSSHSGFSLPWNTVSPPAGTWTLPQTTWSTDACDLQTPSGSTIIPLVKIYNLETGTCPPPSTSSGLAEPQLKLLGASEVLPDKAMAKSFLLAEAFPA